MEGKKNCFWNSKKKKSITSCWLTSSESSNEKFIEKHFLKNNVYYTNNSNCQNKTCNYKFGFIDILYQLS